MNNRSQSVLGNYRSKIVFAIGLAMIAILSVSLFMWRANDGLLSFRNETYARLDDIAERVKQIQVQRIGEKHD